jgi:hypothetical protein
VFAIATDACGRFVGLDHEGWTPAGVAFGFVARSLDQPGSQAMLGGVTGGALAGGDGIFGVLWYSRIGPGIPRGPDDQHPGKLSFSTLSWK